MEPRSLLKLLVLRTSLDVESIDCSSHNHFLHLALNHSIHSGMRSACFRCTNAFFCCEWGDNSRFCVVLMKNGVISGGACLNWPFWRNHRFWRGDYDLRNALSISAGHSSRFWNFLFEVSIHSWHFGIVLWFRVLELPVKNSLYLWVPLSIVLLDWLWWLFVLSCIPDSRSCLHHFRQDLFLSEFALTWLLCHFWAVRFHHVKAIVSSNCRNLCALYFMRNELCFRLKHFTIETLWFRKHDLFVCEKVVCFEIWVGWFNVPKGGLPWVVWVDFFNRLKSLLNRCLSHNWRAFCSWRQVWDSVFHELLLPCC